MLSVATSPVRGPLSLRAQRAWWQLPWITEAWAGDIPETVTVSGGVASAWVGLKLGATFAAAGAARPAYASGEFTTDGAATYMTTGAMTLGIPATVIMAANQPTWATPGHLIDGRSGGNTLAAYQYNTTPRVQLYNGASGIVAEPDSQSDWATATWAIVSMCWSTTSNQAYIKINRSAARTGTNASSTAPSGLTFGAQPGGGQPGALKLRALCVVNGVLAHDSAALEQTIIAMGRRYGIVV